MASTVSRLPGKFVWFEHVSNDVAKARAFYGKLFGWHIESMPMGDQTYYMIQNGDTGIGGFRTAEPGMPSHWVSYVSVDNVDRSFKSAVANGAKAVLPPTDFGPVGRGAGVADPTGANFCLWTSAESDAPDVDKTPFGGWYWNELWTPDAKRAVAFYEKTFGYTHELMSMGDQGDYYILKTGDKSRGGIFQSPDPSTPPMWLPYVHVEDCDATYKQALAAGAKSLREPADQHYGDRLAGVEDPFGFQWWIGTHMKDVSMEELQKPQ